MPRKKNCFEVIQNGGDSNRILQVWIEICYEISGGGEVQT